MRNIDAATEYAVALAKRRGADQVSPDDVLLGCLQAVSRLGVVKLGPWLFDLKALGVDWMDPPSKPGPKVSYSDDVVEIFDRAARIARADSSSGVCLLHLLAAFAEEEFGLMGKLKAEYDIGSAAWRAAAIEVAPQARPQLPPAAAEAVSREYLTPEEAAASLSIHVQTLRNYVRSGKLPALRLAGERSLRIRRADLDKVLEPLTSEK